MPDRPRNGKNEPYKETSTKYPAWRGDRASSGTRRGESAGRPPRAYDRADREAFDQTQAYGRLDREALDQTRAYTRSVGKSRSDDYAYDDEDYDQPRPQGRSGSRSRRTDYDDEEYSQPRQQGRTEREAYGQPKRVEYDGVIYEPSAYAKRGTPSRNRKRLPPPKRPMPHNPKDTEKSSKTKFAAFYIITLLAGVAVCVVLFAMAFQTMTKNNPVIEGTIQSTSSPPPVEGIPLQTSVGMITDITAQSGSGSITLLDIKTNRTHILEVSEATAFASRSGSPMVFSEFSIGQIVDVEYDGQSMKLSSLKEDPEAWTIKNKKQINVDVENAVITVGYDPEQYTFNSQTLVLYLNDYYPIGLITPDDTVTLIGYGDKYGEKQIWCVMLEAGHGFLQLEGADKVVNGTLSVDNTAIFKGLEEMNEPMSMAEGTYRVIVEGSNIEPYITDVVIRPDTTTTLNLIEVEMKTARLSVITVEPGCTIILDGVAVTETGPISLEYGEHSIRVEKEGFIPMEQTVNISKAYTEITFELEKIIKKAKVIIHTTPLAAELYIDNVFVGYSILTTEVEVGEHTIIARKDGYNDSVTTKYFNEGNNDQLYLILTEISTDPLANLPAMDGEEPITEEPVTEQP